MDCAKWWNRHIDEFRRFLQRSEGGEKNEVLWKLVKVKALELKACCVFSIAHTTELMELLAVSTKTSEPTGFVVNLIFFVVCLYAQLFALLWISVFATRH